MAPPESAPSATVTDLAAARRNRSAATERAGSRKTDAKGAGTSSPRKPANRRFDAEKVARLKAEIAEGRYEIDPSRVADRFIEHERNG